MNERWYFIAILTLGLICFLEYLYVSYRFFWAGTIKNTAYKKSICFSLVGVGSIITIGATGALIQFSKLFYLSLTRNVAIHTCLLIIFLSKLLQWYGASRVIGRYPKYQDVLKYRQRESIILYVFVSIEILFLLYSLNRIYFFW